MRFDCAVRQIQQAQNSRRKTRVPPQLFAWGRVSITASARRACGEAAAYIRAAIIGLSSAARKTLLFFRSDVPQGNRRDGRRVAALWMRLRRPMRTEARQVSTSRHTLQRLTLALTEFDLNLERCKVTPVLESSQEFALSLPEHDFDSSGLTVDVKSKVLTAGARCLNSARKINRPARVPVR